MCQELCKLLDASSDYGRHGISLWAASLVFERKDEKVPRTPRIGKAPDTLPTFPPLPPSLQTMAESVISAGRRKSASPWGSPSFQISAASTPSSLCHRSPPPLSSQTRLRSSWSSYQARAMKTKPQGDHVPSPRPFHHPHDGGIQTLRGNTAATPTRLLLPSFQLSVVRALQPFIIVKEH